ncbi:hypothetical protein C8Q80DRAFT_234533 [Daedaleopsis nitida]|nr:hypothetical protein C8Q80DRAFT_234533 [Daedaleopsis nitida]
MYWSVARGTRGPRRLDLSSTRPTMHRPIAAAASHLPRPATSIRPGVVRLCSVESGRGPRRTATRARALPAPPGTLAFRILRDRTTAQAIHHVSTDLASERELNPRCCAMREDKAGGADICRPCVRTDAPGLQTPVKSKEDRELHPAALLSADAGTGAGSDSVLRRAHITYRARTRPAPVRGRRYTRYPCPRRRDARRCSAEATLSESVAVRRRSGQRRSRIHPVFLCKYPQHGPLRHFPASSGRRSQELGPRTQDSGSRT